jgi:hypothetical protein
MTILLLILLVVYFAVVSAPISSRLAGLILILMRNGSRQLPLFRGWTAVRSGAPKSGISAAPEWPRRDNCAIARNAHVQGGKS